MVRSPDSNEALGQVQRVWAYLPAFRAVAETEHLPTAAARLHVVPSALSRSVRLLEEALGAEVFTRRGRRLTLNARGRALLEAVKQSAWALERGINAASGSAFDGPLNVGSIGVLTNYLVLPAVLDLVTAHPGLVPALRGAGPREANHRLALGGLDLAFYYDAIPMDGIWCEKLGELGASLYCGRPHPLFKRARPSLEAVLEHPFSVPQIGDRNLPMDGWPVQLERKVGLHIELLATNLEVCLSGRFLTVLPDIVAAPHLAAKALRRLPFDPLPAIEIFGACREGEEDGPVQRALFEAVRARLRSRSGRAPAR